MTTSDLTNGPAWERAVGSDLRARNSTGRHLPGGSDAVVRFWSQVNFGDQPDGCWLWTGDRTPGGAGHFGLAPPDHRMAHEVAWELAHGSAATHLVLHSCGEVLCCRPSHLFTASESDLTQHRWNAIGSTLDAARAVLPPELLMEFKKALVEAHRRRGFTLLI